MINMNELDYSSTEKIKIELLPNEFDLCVKGIEAYMFIFHNIYSQHDDSDEAWMRDFTAMNLYNNLMSKKNTNYKTNYDVLKNCEVHATRRKTRVYGYAKKYLKKSA